MTHQTHGTSPSLILGCHDENKSERVRNMDSVQVSVKSKPLRGFCLLKRNDAPETMKEDGRKEDYPGDTACETQCNHILRQKQ